MLKIRPGQIACEGTTITVDGTRTAATDIDALTYWTPRVAGRTRPAPPTHHFHWRAGTQETRFKIAVPRGRIDRRKEHAAFAASVVAWLQREVEPGLRARIVRRVAAGEHVKIGACTLTRDGFVLAGPEADEPARHPWADLATVNVGWDSVQILCTTDDPEAGAPGFLVPRAELNTVVLPEIMEACRARWA